MNILTFRAVPFYFIDWSLRVLNSHFRREKTNSKVDKFVVFLQDTLTQVLHEVGMGSPTTLYTFWKKRIKSYHEVTKKRTKVLQNRIQRHKVSRSARSFQEVNFWALQGERYFFSQICIVRRHCGRSLENRNMSDFNQRCYLLERKLTWAD